jgi:hypothetical protein
MNTFVRIAGLTCTALAVGLGAVSAHGETLLCTVIPTVPYTISGPGSYCLDRDFVLSTEDPGAAITIAASHVALDLNGFSIRNTPVHARSAQAYGVYALNRSHVTVRNGTISGFLGGVFVGGPFPPGGVYDSGHVVEGIQADGNTLAGIIVEGAGSIVRSNRVLTVIGSNLQPGAYGIRVQGLALQVHDNTVIEVHGNLQAPGYGLYVDSAMAVVQGNRVSNGRQVPEESIAIAVAQPDVLVVDNRMAFTDRGLVFTGAGGGKFRDNITTAVGVPYTGGEDAGNNQ